MRVSTGSNCHSRKGCELNNPRALLAETSVSWNDLSGRSEEASVTWNRGSNCADCPVKHPPPRSHAWGRSCCAHFPPLL
eukprot:2290710-Rhodomonas_salina.1